MMDDFTPQISHIKQASNVIKDTKKKKKNDHSKDYLI